MFTAPVLSRWFDMVKDHEIYIDEEEINDEALENLWEFSPHEDEEEGLTSEAVVQFVQAVIENFREKLSEPPPEPMFFYCWHDFQVRTLCFSLVSTSHGRLPFGCTVVETDDLMLIADQVVMLDWLHPAYFTPPDDDEPEDEEEQPFVLPVFVTRLP